MKINILMSTYNGEQFFAEQIESIQKQTVKDWTLYIRDDGSSDTTPEIIKHYAQLDSRIVFMVMQLSSKLFSNTFTPLS